MTPGSGGTERNRHLTAEWWLVALLSTALVVLLVAGRMTAQIDNLIYDGFLHVAARAPQSDILIVAIDNRSLEEAGKWPWPRDRHADLINRLSQAHARAVAYDVLFVEPGPAQGDRKLGDAVARGTVFLPLLMRAPGTNGAPFDAILPIPPIGHGAAAVGHVNLVFDDDGLVRRAAPVAGDGTHSWPHLMELMRRIASGGAVGPRVASDATLLIGYAGPPGHFPTVSAASILRGEVPQEFLKGRTILVGATADGLGDSYPVPTAGAAGVMSGIEIQANLLDAMLSGWMIRPVQAIPLGLASLVPLWLMLLAFLRLPPSNTMLLLAALLLGIAATVAGSMLLLRLWLPPTAALVGLAVVYPLWGWRRLAAISAYMVSELERLRNEPGWLPRTEAIESSTAIDQVGRQAALLQGAIRRMEDMHTFVVDRLRQMPDSTFVTDTHGQIVMTNREALDLCQKTGVSPTGNISALIDLLQGSRQEGPSPPFPPAEAIEEKWDCVSEDGRSFDLRGVPQRAQDGECIGWILRIIDTTDLKAAERQREEVLQLLSHDMRSPQTSIIAAIGSAKGGDIDGALARRIQSHAQRTLDLADGFVQLARAESLTYEMEQNDLGDIVVEAVDGLWEQSSIRGIAVDISGVGEGITVMGERSLLSRAMTNLIDNAVKYSGSGKRIICRLERQPAGAVCTVEDEGIGIAAEQIERLFEQFRRAPGATARRIDGSGLGLAFVHTVAARHGGTIQCKSEPGKGTIFTLTLPLAASRD